MQEVIDIKAGIDQVVTVIQAAGGSLIGRTRLQKTVFLLELAGLLEGFNFEYRHYGPYSESLSQTTLLARMTGALEEEERRANWGGTYSVFKTHGTAQPISPSMQSLITLSAGANPIALELAATAAYLAREGYEHPWQETIDRKSDKSQYIEAAKQFYSKILELDTPSRLPLLGS